MRHKTINVDEEMINKLNRCRKVAIKRIATQQGKGRQKFPITTKLERNHEWLRQRKKKGERL